MQASFVDAGAEVSEVAAAPIGSDTLRFLDQHLWRPGLPETCAAVKK